MRDAEIAGLDIAGLDTNGWSHGVAMDCRTGHKRTLWQGWTLQGWTLLDQFGRVDIAGLNISGRVCESELGNMLRFCYGRPVKTQPTGTRVE